MKTIVIATALGAAAALSGVLAPRPAHGSDPAAAGITVAGTGSVPVVPDRAAFSFGVTTPAPTAAAAVKANGAAMRAVVAALKAAGVAAADLQTTRISLDVRRSDDGRTVTGYVTASSVSALLRDLARAGAIVDAAVAAGADSVSGPSLATGDTDALYRQALKAAVADARTKAEALAAAAGVALGRVTAVEESSSQPIPYAAGAADAPDVEPGTRQVQASVTVTFATS